VNAATWTFILAVGFANAAQCADVVPEEVTADRVIRARVWSTPIVCYAREGTTGFRTQLDRPLYQSALETQDKRLKALLAMQALQEMHKLDKPPNPSATASEVQTRTKGLEDYEKMERWYWSMKASAADSLPRTIRSLSPTQFVGRAILRSGLVKEGNVSVTPSNVVVSGATATNGFAIDLVDALIINSSSGTGIDWSRAGPVNGVDKK
jgi:hypothetical protein